ncbi:MAG TPA: hypothetical protein DDY13_14945 [Cytophagales bacterium]|jgi:uncharacterized protein (DUF302 family)|nr:hypothetical protein [Cytophagales bacterium]
MKKNMLILFILVSASFGSMAAPGDYFIKVESNHNLDKTFEMLQDVIESKGLKIFTTIDHSEGAEMAGMELPGTKVIIFGNPKMGTPLMKADRSIGAVLPLKYLVWEEDDKVWVGYVDPAFFLDYYDLKGEEGRIAKMQTALKGMAEAATNK